MERPDRPRNGSITVFVPTIGRPSLRKTVQSFVMQKRIHRDRLIMLGSGWEEPWAREMESEAVRFKKCPRSEYYGHDNVYRELVNLDTDYWMYLGDDDILLPGALDTARYWGELSGFKLLVGQSIHPNGKAMSLIKTRASIPGRLGIGFLQTVIPSWMEMPDFSTFNDCELMDRLLLKYTHFEFAFMAAVLLTMPRFTECSKETWEMLNLNRIGEWEKFER